MSEQLTNDLTVREGDKYYYAGWRGNPTYGGTFVEHYKGHAIMFMGGGYFVRDLVATRKGTISAPYIEGARRAIDRDIKKRSK